MLKYFCIYFLFSSTLSLASLPEYEAPVILARADIGDGYNLPALSFITNSSPVINNRGDVAFKVMSLEGATTQGLWFKSSTEDVGKVIYLAPDERFITDPSLNDNSELLFNLYDEGVTDGLFKIEPATLQVDQILEPTPYKLQHYTYPTIKNNGEVYFRGTNDFNERIYYRLFDDKLTAIISEGVELNGIKPSYLFKPSFNDNGFMVFKARIGEKGQWDESNSDAIVLITPTVLKSSSVYSAQIVAKDKDYDSASVFSSFGNSVSIANDGTIAFVAKIQEGKKTVVLARDNVLKSVAVEGESQIAEIESFSPKVNANGQVIFRAKDSQGFRSIFLADKDQVKKLISEGDYINTDLGPGKILANPNFPGFGGEIDFNDSGDIVFHAIIVNADDSSELGEAIYKMSSKK